MPTAKRARENLEEILTPIAMRSPVKLNLVREIAISSQKVDITLTSATLNPGTQNWLNSKASENIGQLSGVSQVNVNFIETPPKEINDVSHVIAVMSSKGGVDKSLVATLVSIALTRQEKGADILDADITGPRIPNIFAAISQSGILETLGGLPEGNLDCALLAPNTVKAIIQDYIATRKELWKRLTGNAEAKSLPFHGD